MVDEALSRMSLSEISVAIAKRKVSSQEVVRNSLDQLEKRRPSLNCLARLFPEQDLAEAKLSDQELSSGNLRGPLHGIPLAHKDMFYRAGKIAACGSKICEDYVPDVTATALTKLDQAGSLILAG